MIAQLSSPAAFAETFLGFTPHEKQREWMASTARVRVACCGRRWGKSYSSAADLIWFAVTHPGTEQFVIAPTSDQARIIMGYVSDMVMRIPGFADSDNVKIAQSPFPLVRIKDSQIHGRSAGDSGQNVRGHGADRVLLDEAAYIPAQALDALSPLLATSPYGQQIFISTAFGKNHFWELFLQGQSDDPEYESFQYPSWTSPYVSESYIEQQRGQMTDLAFRVEYGAEFAEDQNAVFRWSDIQAAISSDIDREYQRSHQYVIGWDPAKFHDRSGVIVLDITTTPWTVMRCLDLSGRDYEPQVTAVASLAAEFGGAHVLVDSTHNEPLLEMARGRKLSVEGFQFSNASKEEIINNLALVLEQRRLRFPHEPALIKELQYYRYTLTAAGNVKLGAPEKSGHYDDLVTALALAVQMAGRPQPMRGNRTAVSGPRPILTDYKPR